jgi:hypothetical protein
MNEVGPLVGEWVEAHIVRPIFILRHVHNNP